MSFNYSKCSNEGARLLTGHAKLLFPIFSHDKKRIFAMNGFHYVSVVQMCIGI